jgi:hypothetical protein
MKLYIRLVLLAMCIQIGATAPEEPQKIEPIKVGNLSLPTSQMPGTLFAFGQTIIEKGDIVGYGYFDGIKGCNRRLHETIPFGIIGITDKLAFSAYFPVALSFKENDFKSSGIEDIYLFAEYAFFDKPTHTAYNFATICGAIFLPTGSLTKAPATGNGAVSLFLGFTIAHLAIDWYYFTSQGVIVTQKNKCLGEKVGDSYLYQFGLGHNIKSPKGWIFLGLIELFGSYSGDYIFDNKIACDSESNVIFLAPSFFMSNERFSFHAGIGYCISQHLPAGSNKDHYIYAVEFGWKFDGPALKGKPETDFVR